MTANKTNKRKKYPKAFLLEPDGSLIEITPEELGSKYSKTSLKGREIYSDDSKEYRLFPCFTRTLASSHFRCRTKHTRTSDANDKEEKGGPHENRIKDLLAILERNDNYELGYNEFDTPGFDTECFKELDEFVNRLRSKDPVCQWVFNNLPGTVSAAISGYSNRSGQFLELLVKGLNDLIFNKNLDLNATGLFDSFVKRATTKNLIKYKKPGPYALLNQYLLEDFFCEEIYQTEPTFIPIAKLSNYKWQKEVWRILDANYRVRHDIMGGILSLSDSQNTPRVAIEIVHSHFPSQATYGSLAQFVGEC
jgi:hypothetical protein